MERRRNEKMELGRMLRMDGQMYMEGRVDIWMDEAENDG